MVTDDFTGTGALSGNWTVAQGSWTRTSDKGSPASAGSYSWAYWSANSFNDNHTSQFIISTLPTGDPEIEYVGPAVRMSGSGGTTNGYAIMVDEAGTTAYFRKVTNGSGSSLDSAAVTVINGDELRVEVTGSSTTTVKLFVNDVEDASFTDSTSPHTTGAPGIMALHTTARIDDWVGTGEIVASSTKSLALLGVGS